MDDAQQGTTSRVQLTWRPDVEDVADLVVLIPTKVPLRIALVALVPLLVGVAGIVLDVPAVAVVGLVVALALMLFALLLPRLLRRDVRRDVAQVEERFGEQVLAFVDDERGLRLETAHATQDLGWDQLGPVRRTDRLWLVHIGGRRDEFVLLARRGVRTPADAEQVDRMLRTLPAHR